MTKPKNNGKPWTKEDIQTLKDDVHNLMSTRDIAKDLERTEDAIRNKASEIDLSLKPKDPK